MPEPGRDDQGHKDDEIDDQHDGCPYLEARLERGPRGPPETDSEGFPRPLDQPGVELVEEIPRIGDFQVAPVGLEQALERGLGLLLGHARGGHDIAEGGAAAQAAQRGQEGRVGLGGGYCGYFRQFRQSLNVGISGELMFNQTYVSARKIHSLTDRAQVADRRARIGDRKTRIASEQTRRLFAFSAITPPCVLVDGKRGGAAVIGQ